MGLIRVVGSSVADVLGEQWKEVFRCGEMDINTLMVRAHKLITKGSSNNDPNDQTVTNGSLLIVADGQCVIVVSQGKVLDYSSEPGEHIFRDTTRGQGLSGVAHQIGKRIAYGGVQAVTDRVYYVNMKECFDNPFRTPEPVPLHLQDSVTGLSIDTAVSLEGLYSYRVKDPLKFYKTLTGNIEGIYTRSRLTGQITSTLLNSLPAAFHILSGEGVRPSQLPEHFPEFREALRKGMEESWAAQHGLEISGITISSLVVDGSQIFTQLQQAAVFREEEQWACECGQINTGKYCTECGRIRE